MAGVLSLKEEYRSAIKVVYQTCCTACTQWYYTGYESSICTHIQGGWSIKEHHKPQFMHNALAHSRTVDTRPLEEPGDEATIQSCYIIPFTCKSVHIYTFG